MTDETATSQPAAHPRNRAAAIHVGLGYLTLIGFLLFGAQLWLNLAFDTFGLQRGFHLDYLIEAITLPLGLVFYPAWAALHGDRDGQSSTVRSLSNLLLILTIISAGLLLINIPMLPRLFGV